MTLREAAQQALDYMDSVGQDDMYSEEWDVAEALRAALAAPSVPSGEPDWRHPKIQALIGAKARREIELQLVEQLLDDPDCDLTSLDMEYWHNLHDKLRERLTAPQPVPDALRPIPRVFLHMPDGDERKARTVFTEWKDGDNLHVCVLLDERAAHRQPAPLTDETVRELVGECGLDWHRGYMPLFADDPTNRYEVLCRAIEAAHGIVPAPTTGEGQ